MKSDTWDLSWCRQRKDYKVWLPSMKKEDPPAVKEKADPEQLESKNISTPACFSCGSISFMPAEKCDICRKPFYPPKAKSKEPRSKRKSSKKQRRKMSFREFEATKIKINKLNEEWVKGVIKEPPPSGLGALKTKINRLQTDLENNLHLVFLFQTGKGYYDSKNQREKTSGSGELS